MCVRLNKARCTFHILVLSSKDPLNQDLMGFFIVVLAFLLFVSFEGGLEKTQTNKVKPINISTNMIFVRPQFESQVLEHCVL